MKSLGDPDSVVSEVNSKIPKLALGEISLGP